jgi:hypothetical protein
MNYCSVMEDTACLAFELGVELVVIGGLLSYRKMHVS